MHHFCRVSKVSHHSSHTLSVIAYLVIAYSTCLPYYMSTSQSFQPQFFTAFIILTGSTIIQALSMPYNGNDLNVDTAREALLAFQPRLASSQVVNGVHLAHTDADGQPRFAFGHTPSLGMWEVDQQTRAVGVNHFLNDFTSLTLPDIVSIRVCNVCTCASE